MKTSTTFRRMRSPRKLCIIDLWGRREPGCSSSGRLVVKPSGRGLFLVYVPMSRKCPTKMFAVFGFKRGYWLVVAGLVGHGVSTSSMTSSSTTPVYRNGGRVFCLPFDLVIDAWLAMLLIRQRQAVRGSTE